MSKKVTEEEIASKKVAKEKAMKLLPDCVDTRFTVVFQSDGTGQHLTAIVERDEEDNAVMKKNLPTKIDRWRTIIVFVPKGYIEVFYP